MPDENSYNPKPDLALDLNVRQEQRLSLQQRQALALLQASRAELESVVKNELDTNPALEEYCPEEEDGEDEAFANSFSMDDKEDGRGEREEKEENSLDEIGKENEEWEDYVREEAGEDLEYSDQKTMRKKYDYVMNSLYAPATLADDLKDQFALDLPADYEPIYTYLISSLDEKGFLTESVKEMADKLGVKKEMVEKTVKLLQSYDPPGLGASDLRESFLLQLERKGLRDSNAYKIISDHYDDMLHQRFQTILNSLKIGKEELKGALETIGTLDFRPGRDLTYTEAKNAVADVVVRENEDGSFAVEMNEEKFPYVRISKSFVSAMRAKDLKSRAFVSDRIKAGKNFIGQLQFYKRTILLVAEAIVAHQEDFLRNGPGHMRPLTMRELAEELNLSDSTVSRAIAKKYMDTPQGLMEMKDFFSRVAASENGSETSGADAKTLLKEIIDGENKEKPYGDDEIAKLMAERGCAIARRTVVKYREALGIPSSRLRKKIL